MFTQREKNQLLKMLQATIDEIKSAPVQTPCDLCVNCERGGMTQPWCRAAGQYIPEEVQPVGCEGYIYDHTSPPF